MNKSLFSQKYVPLHKLNEGHMGEVFLARQTGLSGFQREVVLRHIHPQISKNSRATEILLEEIQFASQLSHANIVHLYDVVEDEGSYFVVLERIKGASLGELRKHTAQQGKMIPLGLAINIVTQVLEGLRYAHSFCDESGRYLNIVHRGICPSNVLVSFFGNTKLLDFGLCRASEHCRDETDISPDKYEYMSPEVIHRGNVDHRSDLFSVGILLYELTVGQRLFRVPSFAAMKEMIAKPIAPPTYARAGYPADLENIVMCALERDPADRFDDAEEMLEQLEQFTFDAGLRLSRLRLGQYVTRLMGVSTQKQFPEEETAPEECSVPIAEELGFDGKGIFQRGGQKFKKTKKRKKRRRQLEVERLAQEAIAELVPPTDHDRENDTVEIPALDRPALIAQTMAPLKPLSESTMVVTDEQVEEEIELSEEEPILQAKRSLFDKETVVQYVGEKTDGQVTIRVTPKQLPKQDAEPQALRRPEEQEEVTQRKGPPEPSLDLKAALAEISNDLQSGAESDRRRIQALEQAIDDLGDETIVPLPEKESAPIYETGPAVERAEYLLVKKSDSTGAASADELERIDGPNRAPDELEQSDLGPLAVKNVRIPTGKIISPIREDGDVELELDGETISLDEDDSAIEVIADEDLEEVGDDGLDDRTLEIPPTPTLLQASGKIGSVRGKVEGPAVGRLFTKPSFSAPRPMGARTSRSPRRASGPRSVKASQRSRSSFKMCSKKPRGKSGRARGRKGKAVRSGVRSRPQTG